MVLVTRKGMSKETEEKIAELEKKIASLEQELERFDNERSKKVQSWKNKTQKLIAS